MSRAIRTSGLKLSKKLVKWLSRESRAIRTSGLKHFDWRDAAEVSQVSCYTHEWIETGNPVNQNPVPASRAIRTSGLKPAGRIVPGIVRRLVLYARVD